MKLYRFMKKGEVSLVIEMGDEVYECINKDPVHVLREYLQGGRIKGCTKIPYRIHSLIENELQEYRIIRPVDPPEVWGAGITYKISRERYSEAKVAVIGGKSIYERIYDSNRPEIFFKDSGIRCVGHNMDICVRSDSRWTLPEPELGIVLDSDGTVLGYTVVNDVTARDIEAANPLYLPQAKIYRGSCSFGPCIATPDEISNPYGIQISLKILRGGDVLYEGRVSTSRMARRVDQLIEYLLRDNIIMPGTLLMTGTGIVPGEDISLEDGDIVEIFIEGIGILRNRVVKL